MPFRSMVQIVGTSVGKSLPSLGLKVQVTSVTLKEGSTDYSGYNVTTDIDTAGCKSKCLADASCKAVEVNDKNTCWYYNGNEYSQPSTESGHRCLRRK